MKKEVAVGTIVQETQRGNDDCHPRWERTRHAELFERYGALQAQGTSQRQAAQLLNVPRSTLQAWQVYQESLDERPAVVAFFHSPAGASIMAPATPFRYCTTQKHLTVKIIRNSRA